MSRAPTQTVPQCAFALLRKPETIRAKHEQHAIEPTSTTLLRLGAPQGARPTVCARNLPLPQCSIETVSARALLLESPARAEPRCCKWHHPPTSAGTQHDDAAQGTRQHRACPREHSGAHRHKRSQGQGPPAGLPQPEASLPRGNPCPDPAADTEGRRAKAQTHTLLPSTPRLTLRPSHDSEPACGPTASA